MTPNSNFFRPKHSTNIHSNGNSSIYSILDKRNFLYSKSVIESDFQIVNVNNGKYVVFVSLTEEQNKYLCIYFESHNPVYDVLLKLISVFEYVE